MATHPEVWILGAAGRSGRAAAIELAGKGVSLVLVGRDAARLRELAGSLAGDGGTPRVVSASLDTLPAELARAAPSVVLHTIGPFVETALPVLRAAPHAHYVDLSNELPATLAVLALHDEAVAAGRTLVTGAGSGVLATESVVLALAAGRPPAARARVDALPWIAEGGLVGDALAGTIVETIAGGARRYEQGGPVRTRVGVDFERLTLPDGSRVGALGVPTGELAAAHRASGAPFVVAGASEIPTHLLVRCLLPALSAAMSLGPVRRAARRRLAAMSVPPAPPGRRCSYAHARLEWPDGTRREGWLRYGEAMAFTARVAAEVTLRLARGEGRPGAYTPGALFGSGLAVELGGELRID